jgi:hypothetical protein
MYAPHFAAALAIGSRVRRAPLWALLVGAFLPDLVWIVLARIGVEPAQASSFFDDWSHSLFSIAVVAILFAVFFWKLGRSVVVAVWVAVFSHFLLDFPVHPKRLALFPKSKMHLGWDLLAWGSAQGWLGAINDWWLQLAVLLGLLLFYVLQMRRKKVSLNLILAPCVVLFGLQLLTLYSCIGY